MEQHFDNGCPVTAKEWQAEQKELEQKAGKAVLKSRSRSPLRRKSAPVPEPPEPPRKKSGPKDVDVDEGSGGFWSRTL